METEGTISFKDACNTDYAFRDKQTVKPMPLLVIQWAMALTKEQHRAIDAVISKRLEDAGWKCIIVGAMDTSCATAYMPNGGDMEAMSIDDIVSRIKGESEGAGGTTPTPVD